MSKLYFWILVIVLCLVVTAGTSFVKSKVNTNCSPICDGGVLKVKRGYPFKYYEHDMGIGLCPGPCLPNYKKIISWGLAGDLAVWFTVSVAGVLGLDFAFKARKHNG
jgi:hypothetical protein